MVRETVFIGKKNGYTLWQETIERETENVRIVFQSTQEGEMAPNGYQYINFHMVFDIKIKYLHWKAYLVAGGHVIHTPDVITFSSMVIKDIVCISLIMAVLHDLELKATDVFNAYIIALNREKIWTVLSSEFGDDDGKH